LSRLEMNPPRCLFCLNHPFTRKSTFPPGWRLIRRVSLPTISASAKSWSINCPHRVLASRQPKPADSRSANKSMVVCRTAPSSRRRCATNGSVADAPRFSTGEKRASAGAITSAQRRESWLIARERYWESHKCRNLILTQVERNLRKRHQ
jgi:hypothetical protein